MALIITEVTGFDETVAILMVWASYTLFTVLGSRGVIPTDTAMFLLFSGIIVVASLFIVDAAGGWFHAIQSLATYTEKPDLIAWHGGLAPRCIGRRRSMACFGPPFWGSRGNRRRSQPVAKQSLFDGQ